MTTTKCRNCMWFNHPYRAGYVGICRYFPKHIDKYANDGPCSKFKSGEEEKKDETNNGTN